MQTLMAGPSGTRHPGEIHDLSAKEAAMLVDGGYAVAVEASEGRKAKKEQVAPLDPDPPAPETPSDPPESPIT